MGLVRTHYFLSAFGYRVVSLISRLFYWGCGRDRRGCSACLSPCLLPPSWSVLLPRPAIWSLVTEMSASPCLAWGGLGLLMLVEGSARLGAGAGAHISVHPAPPLAPSP